MPLASIKDQITLIRHYTDSAIRAETRGDHAAVAEFLTEVAKAATEGAAHAQAISDDGIKTP